MSEILKAPPLVRGKVLSHLDVDQIFTLTEASPIVLKSIRRIRWRMLDTIVDFEDCKGKARICCEQKGTVDKKVSWSLLTKNDKFIPEMKINNTVFHLKKLHPELESTFTWTNDDFIIWFTHHSLRLFSDLFGGPNGITCGMRIEQMQDVPNLRMIRGCVITDDNAHSKDVSMLCRYYQGRTLLLYPYVLGDIEETTPMMNIPHLYVKNAHWFNRKHLVNFTGKNGFFFNANVSTDDCIAFVRNWMKREDRRLRSLVIRPRPGVSFSEKKVADEFAVDGMEWNPEKRQRYYKYEDEWKMNVFEDDEYLLDGKLGIDIVRPADDLLCTIRVTDNAFCFFVWRHPFQNQRNAD